MDRDRQADNNKDGLLDSGRLRVRELGIKPGIFESGKNNAITDVDAVLVGHYSLTDDDSINTGATAILPHDGNIYQNKLPAAVVAGNGFGKMMGFSQIEELGEIETPIVLTNTLSVPQAAEAILDWTLAMAGNEKVKTVNPIVGETNDGLLNDIRSRHLRAKHIFEAITKAKTGLVQEGNIGAGMGTVAFGWKGGIGSSSRVLPASLGGFTVGILLQSNFGGVLCIDGVPVGKELGQYYLKNYIDDATADGSIMIVIATDAPLSDRNLKRLAKRAFSGLARTGAAMSNGSGDYAISFSTVQSVRRTAERSRGVSQIENLANDDMSALFQAVIESTEEAVYNSMLMADSVTARDPILDETRTIRKLPIGKLRQILKKYGR